jgi:hypothetical protein
MTVNLPFEIRLSFIPAADTDPGGSVRVQLTQPRARVSRQAGAAEAAEAREATIDLQAADTHRDLKNTWIFQASPKFSNVKGVVRSVEEPVCLVHQFGKEMMSGDRVYLWESGPRRGGIIGLAKVAETPRIQAEPIEQLPFIREAEKFAGDQLRVKLRMLKRMEPVISRKYLLSRPELAGLTILRCARGTNFRVTREQAAALEKVLEAFEAFFPKWNGSGEKRIVFAQG